MPLPKGTMTVDILPDGRVRVESGDMGGVQHQSADDFMTGFTRLLGGEVTTEKVEEGHHHHHEFGDDQHHHHHSH